MPWPPTTHRFPFSDSPVRCCCGSRTSAGLPVVAEAFADRGYAADGRLVPRSHPRALLHDPGEVAERVLRIASEGTLLAVDGTLIAVPARSVCTHGDTPGAVELARAVRARLEAAGVTITPFAAFRP